MNQKIDDYKKLPGFEYKQFPTFIKDVDEEQGIVNHFVAVIGNRDEGGDRIAVGAFTKTISERGPRIKVLDQHQMDSVTKIVGKPIALRETGRNELTQEMLDYAPEATGGLLATTQYAINTTRGLDVFRLVKGGYAPESSIGYDALDVEYIKEKDITGKEVTTRVLKTIRLWEYSNVVFGMNQATSVLSAKGKKPDEGKPWDVFHEGDKWYVYKVDEEGNKIGEALGEHDSEEDARAQVDALYANEKPEKEMTPRGPVRRLGDFLQGSLHQVFTMLCDEWYKAGYLSTDERINLSSLIGSALKILADGMSPELANIDLDERSNLMFLEYIAQFDYKSGRVIAKRNAERLSQIRKLLQEIEEDGGLGESEPEIEIPKSTTPPTEAGDKKAGSSQTPTSDDLLKLIEIEQLEISYMR